jgi:hypothetical protein
MQARLHEIKALGVTLALDDFGTGYSSLSCLHELPIDVVKIDRSFVSLAQTSDYHRVLIEATVLMARTLGMNTLAEGIETVGQADLMRALGCGKGQGYLFSATAGPRDALVRWIEAGWPAPDGLWGPAMKSHSRLCYTAPVCSFTASASQVAATGEPGPGVLDLPACLLLRRADLIFVWARHTAGQRCPGTGLPESDRPPPAPAMGPAYLHAPPHWRGPRAVSKGQTRDYRT